MINLRKYFFDLRYKMSHKPTYVDSDFWDNLYLIDIEESDSCVRYCFAIYEPIN